MQKTSLWIPSIHSSGIIIFGVPSSDWLIPKFLNHLLICVKLYQHAKNQLVLSVLSWDTFWSPDTRLTTLIFALASLKTFLLTFNFGEFYQNAKNKAALLICSEEMLDLKTLQSEWLRAFWPLSQERHFSQIEDLYRDTTNNINFHFRVSSEKINDQIFL